MTNYYEIQELALYAMGKTEEEVDSILNDGDPEDCIYDHFDVDYEQFAKIVRALLPFTPVVESAVTKEHYHAFMRKDGDYSIAIIKEPVEDQQHD